jgi:hypothetical protein
MPGKASSRRAVSSAPDDPHTAMSPAPAKMTSGPAEGPGSAMGGEGVEPGGPGAGGGLDDWDGRAGAPDSGHAPTLTTTASKGTSARTARRGIPFDNNVALIQTEHQFRASAAKKRIRSEQKTNRCVRGRPARAAAPRGALALRAKDQHRGELIRLSSCNRRSGRARRARCGGSAIDWRGQRHPLPPPTLANEGTTRADTPG